MLDGRLCHDAILSRLRTARVGRRVEVLDQVDSTNRHVLVRLREADNDGLVAVAETQTAGRGRRGRRWECPNGAGILCTVGLRDDAGSIRSNLLSLIVPIAICDGVRAATEVACEIKWPNDLVVGHRKLAGILIEARGNTAGQVCYAIGFGVNCLQHSAHFPPELREHATSLEMESDRPIDRAAVLISVLCELDRWLAAPLSWEVDDVRARWMCRAKGMGGRVCVEHEGRRYLGNLIDIDPTSGVVVQLDEGGRRLFDASSTTISVQPG
jgi:BirA family biotin operon repressor/biotin-[acetyl-CoA-carboxylase] ligase